MSSRKHEMGALRAVIGSFLGLNPSYFPRFKDSRGRYDQIQDAKIIQDIVRTLDDLALPANGDFKSYLERGRETLDEVKSLTEYQDQKTTRLLTIIAFLSALSGALFSRFADAYPLQATVARLGGSGHGILVTATYGFFALFALSAVAGALVVFHATRTRFKYPDPEPQNEGAQPRRPDSYLFFPGIIKVTPVNWAKAFLSVSGQVTTGAIVDPQLSMHYFKNYVIESYLVAAKVADKLRYLQPAQSILAFAVRILLIWILLFAITTATVPGDGH